MVKSDDSVQDLINGPLDFLASISPSDEQRRAYRTYLRSLPPSALENIIYDGKAWQSHAAMRELLNRKGQLHLPKEQFEAELKAVRDNYWAQYVRPKELAWWREYITSGRFYKDKAAENAEILFARENRSRSTYKKKRDHRAINIPSWVRAELQAEIRAARKAALLEGLKV